MCDTHVLLSVHLAHLWVSYGLRVCGPEAFTNQSFDGFDLGIMSNEGATNIIRIGASIDYRLLLNIDH